MPGALLTFVIPYMVDGLMIVSSGVLCRGVLAPNTAMVLGAYTHKPWAAARSNTFCSALTQLQVL